MKLFLFLCFSFSMCFPAISQDITDLIREADRLESVPDEKAAFQKFKLIHKYAPKNVYALTKCSELCSRIGNREKDFHARDNYYAAAIMYAREALKLDPQSDEANVVMGIAIGRTSLVKSGKEKISAAKEIKRYAENAIRINPNNFKAWHILGKWNYEVSNLNMMEKAATRVFYGGLPDASLKKAIDSYEKARSLSSTFLLNYLELAKAYKRNNEKQKAVDLLKAMLPLAPQTEDDPRIKREGIALLKSLQ